MFHALSSVPTTGLRAPPPPAGARDVERGPDEPVAGTRQTAALRNGGAGISPLRRVEALTQAKEAPSDAKPRDPEGLTEEQQRHVQKLKQTDAKVRAHEQAHAAAGGQYAGGASYEFVTGPDGKRYAVGGEVQIDISPVKDNPAATVRKMETVIRAALAPAEPSSQDQAVAREAAKIRSAAQAEVQKSRAVEAQGNGEAAPAGAIAGAVAARGSGEDGDAGARLAAARAYGGTAPSPDAAPLSAREERFQQLCACGAVH